MNIVEAVILLVVVNIGMMVAAAWWYIAKPIFKYSVGGGGHRDDGFKEGTWLV